MARLTVVHPSRRFQLVAFDLQTITLRTIYGNSKIVVSIDVSARLSRAVQVKKKRGPFISKVLMEECISIFGPMVKLCSERGTVLDVEFFKPFVILLEVKQVLTYILHFQANGAVKRRIHKLARNMS